MSSSARRKQERTSRCARAGFKIEKGTPASICLNEKGGGNGGDRRCRPALSLHTCAQEESRAVEPSNRRGETTKKRRRRLGRETRGVTLHRGEIKSFVLCLRRWAKCREVARRAGYRGRGSLVDVIKGRGVADNEHEIGKPTKKAPPARTERTKNKAYWSPVDSKTAFQTEKETAVLSARRRRGRE